MEQQGKFVLFEADELGAWLDATAVSRVIRLVQNHHTWKPSYAEFTGTNHFALLRGMERAHLDRGFSEIAQNLTTFPDGKVAVCRSLDRIPAGILGANRDAVCIENLGNFDEGQDVMTPAHRDCVLRVNALLCRRFGLVPSTTSVVFHHWYDLITGQRTDGAGTTKTCPGTRFFAGNSVASAQRGFIPLIRQELEAGAGAQPPRPTGALFTGEVAVEVLNVRGAPSTAAAIVKRLHRGVEVSIYEVRDGWYRIDPGSLWVDSHFVATQDTQRARTALFTAQVVANTLNVRTLPALAGAVAGQLARGATAYVYEQRDGWCRIDPTEPRWVSSDYLEAQGAHPAVT